MRFYPEMSLKISRRLPATRRDMPMKELISKHDVLFLDAYGVFRSSQGFYPGAEYTLKEIKRQGKIVGIASNTSGTTPEQNIRSWIDKGLTIDPELNFTAGMVLRECVEGMGLVGAPAIVLGSEVSCQYARRADLTLIPEDEAMQRYNEVKAVIISENVSFHRNHLADAAANAIFKNNVPLILNTTDRFIPYFHDREPRGVSFGVYATAQTFASLTGAEPIIIGKPGQLIFNRIHDVINGRGISPEKVLFVGDNLFEDIAGAAIAGFHSLLVESGISGAVKRGEIRGLVAQTDKELTESGIRPTYQLPSILI